MRIILVVLAFLALGCECEERISCFKYDKEMAIVTAENCSKLTGYQGRYCFSHISDVACKEMAIFHHEGLNAESRLGKLTE